MDAIHVPFQYWVYGLGFVSQGLFAVRLLIQWYLSEKEGKITSPVIYWYISVVACYLFIVYGILQNDWIIIVGQGLNYIIFIRNLQLDGSWRRSHASFRWAALGLPLLTLLWLVVHPPEGNTDFNNILDVIFLCGAVGQLLLNFRFVYQWYVAERTNSPVLPIGFWIMTAVGSVLVVIYAVDRTDPVLLFAQALGLLVAIRNIQLYYRSKSRLIDSDT